MRGITIVTTAALLVAAFQLGCVDQPTQPAPNASAVRPSPAGRWGIVPPGASRKSSASSAATTAAVSVSQFTNGSFETGDYTGWTLFESAPLTDPTFGTWGIATNGETIQPGQMVFDFFDRVDVPESSTGLPHTYTATNGNYVALQLQNGPQVHRMYQDISLPAGATTISWDTEYSNHNPDDSHNSAFVANAQELIVDVRDVSTDAILATLFRTVPGVSPLSIPMTHFTADVSAFAGKTVRISVDLFAIRAYFDAAFDDFKVDVPVAATKKQCKNGGWKSLVRADGSAFGNQGDCIQYVNTGK